MDTGGLIVITIFLTSTTTDHFPFSDEISKEEV